MPPAAGVTSPSDRVPMVMPTTVQPAPGMITEAFAKDAIIAWFRGEFAAANAIIDALCNHLTQLEGGRGHEYDSVFAAIHRRRLNWIQILQMQNYCSINDVSTELQKVAAKKVNYADAKQFNDIEVSVKEKQKHQNVPEEESMENIENGGSEVVDEDFSRDESPKSGITDTGSQEAQQKFTDMELCSNHEECEARRAQIKMTKGFIAKEPVKGHTVNVVRGLKLYDDVFTDTELSTLTDFVSELRVAGQNGELSGDTFIMYNQQQSKRNKRELIQLGAPIFGHVKEDASSQIEPIPPLLQGVIDHLIQWNLISENRKPNSCIINFFDEGEYSQPFQKPPHLEQPISTLLLSESTMAFGRTLVSDNDGNYKGPLTLSLNQGTLLVMRGNSADMARHVMCASSDKRVSITFFKVRTNTIDTNASSTMQPLNRAMTLWQPGMPTPYAVPNGVLNGYEGKCMGINMLPKWGVIRSPLVMLAPMHPTVLSPKSMPSGGGTGVFLPWTVGSRKPARHLPPRAQRGKLLALPSPIETHMPQPISDTSIISV